jgi:hypothetical protein
MELWTGKDMKYSSWNFRLKKVEHLSNVLVNLGKKVYRIQDRNNKRIMGREVASLGGEPHCCELRI